MGTQAWDDGKNWKRTFGPRIIAIRLIVTDRRNKTVPIFLVSVYAPHSDKSEDEKVDFEQQFDLCLRSSCAMDVVGVGKDTNASIGVRKYSSSANSRGHSVTGRYGLNHRNKAGNPLEPILKQHVLILDVDYLLLMLVSPLLTVLNLLVLLPESVVRFDVHEMCA